MVPIREGPWPGKGGELRGQGFSPGGGGPNKVKWVGRPPQKNIGTGLSTAGAGTPLPFWGTTGRGPRGGPRRPGGPKRVAGGPPTKKGDVKTGQKNSSGRGGGSGGFSTARGRLLPGFPQFNGVAGFGGAWPPSGQAGTTYPGRLPTGREECTLYGAAPPALGFQTTPNLPPFNIFGPTILGLRPPKRAEKRGGRKGRRFNFPPPRSRVGEGKNLWGPVRLLLGKGGGPARVPGFDQLGGRLLDPGWGTPPGDWVIVLFVLKKTGRTIFGKFVWGSGVGEVGGT